MKIKDFVGLVKETISEWSDDKASRLAAALSYYTTFSLVPLLVVVIAVAGLIMGGQNQVQSQVLSQIKGLVGQQGSDFVASMINYSHQRQSAGIVATIIGTATLIFAAAGLFGALQDALNTIWEVKPKPIKGLGKSITSFLMKRFLSFTMILGIGFLLLVSLVLSTVLASLTGFLGLVLPFSQIVLQTINFLVSFGVITLLFAMIYKILPDAEMDWEDVWLGAAVTSLLFTIGKFAIGLYLGQSNVATSFGAAGSLAILLIWIYYSAQILFLGAEFTQVYADKYGSGVRPDKNSMFISEEERLKQGMTRQGGVSPAAGTASQPVLATTGLSRTDSKQATTVYPYSGGYIYRGRQGRKGIGSRLLYGVLLASQFIPAILNLSSIRSRIKR